jgi:hypothetical protein
MTRPARTPLPGCRAPRMTASRPERFPGSQVPACGASPRRLSSMTGSSAPPTIKSVGACTLGSASPARSGRPPREMTAWTRSGHSPVPLTRTSIRINPTGRSSRPSIRIRIPRTRQVRSRHAERLRYRARIFPQPRRKSAAPLATPSRNPLRHQHFSRPPGIAVWPCSCPTILRGKSASSRCHLDRRGIRGSAERLPAVQSLV